MGKYDHLEVMRSKLASRMRSKKIGSALANLWFEFDQCLKDFKPSCKENEEIVKRLKDIQDRIKETMGVEDMSNG